METGLPSRAYTDSSQAQAERALFGRGWHYVGSRASLGLASPDPAIVPVAAGLVDSLLVKSSEGELRAFVNACAHRGARLVDEPCSRLSISCPYHGWTYGLDGRLRSAPRLAHEGLAVDELGIQLSMLPVMEWKSLVFVGTGGVTNEQFAAWWRPVAEGLDAAGIDPSELRYSHRASGSCAADWKVVVENYLECYHCQIAHPGLSATLDVRPNQYEQLIEDQVAIQRARRRGAEGDEAQPEGLFWLAFPNLVVNVLPGPTNLSIGPVLPHGAGASTRFLDYYFDPDAPESEVNDLIAWDDQVGVEDVRLVELVQRGIEARVLAGAGDDPLRVMPESERLVTWFADRIKAAASPDASDRTLG